MGDYIGTILKLQNSSIGTINKMKPFFQTTRTHSEITIETPILPNRNSNDVTARNFLLDATWSHGQFLPYAARDSRSWWVLHKGKTT